MARTPTPWMHTRQGLDDQNTFTHISGSPRGFGDIATVWGVDDNAQQNAEFIVEAVNNHDLLIRALTEILDAANDPYEIARAALKAVNS